MVLLNETTGGRVADRAVLLTTFVERLLGVMGKRIPMGCAVGIAECDWVHTFFVRGPLDLLYCDRAGSVLYVAPEIPPFRVGPRVPGADVVWELPGGSLKTRPVALRDRLRLGE